MTVAVLMASCDDIDKPMADEPVDEIVGFSGEMLKAGVSKAGDGESEWLDMRFDTWMWNNSDGTGQSPVSFVVHQNTDGGSKTASAVYRLKPGETNRLECIDGQTPLNWQSKTAVHEFRAWTEPAGVTMDASLVSGAVDMTKRNLDYEYFVGAGTQELSYGTHGLTVALGFEHLVGKLIIDKISLIYSDKIETQDMWGRVGGITFPNMPTTGEFTTGVGNDNDMAVVPDGKGKGLLFSLAGNDDYNEYIKKKCIPFYVMPMSFAGNDDYGEFYVNIMHPQGDFRRYKGNLKDLVNEDASGSTLSGIKAGECLTVRLVLQDDSVDGFFAYVENWSDTDNLSIKDIPYPGIYTVDDLVNNVTADSQEWKVFILTPDDDMIYDTTEDGDKIIRIFDNIDLSRYADVVIRIVVPEGCVLDGLGHNITGIPGLEIVGDVRNLYINGVPCQG